MTDNFPNKSENGLALPAFCQKHWDRLRDEVDNQGLSQYVSANAEIAIMKTTAEMRGEHTESTWDPLLNTYYMMLARFLEEAGDYLIAKALNEKVAVCPMCEAMSMRSEDGRCLCGNPECEASEPGSIEDFDTWFESAVQAQKQYATEQGWIK